METDISDLLKDINKQALNFNREGKAYVVSVYDFECDNLEIEGIFENLCKAIIKVNKVVQDLYENAYYNENKTIKAEWFFNDDCLINKVVISGNDIKLFEIRLIEGNIK